MKCSSCGLYHPAQYSQCVSCGGSLTDGGPAEPVSGVATTPRARAVQSSQIRKAEPLDGDDSDEDELDDEEDAIVSADPRGKKSRRSKTHRKNNGPIFVLMTFLFVVVLLVFAGVT